MKALELFAASGGLALGFQRAGIEFEISLDFDRACCDSYEQNIGRRPAAIDAREFLRLVEGGVRQKYDLVVADPPCAPYSRLGKSLGARDPRDALVVTTEIIRRLRPKAFLIGNIPGLDLEPHRLTLEATIGRLERDGYCVADHAVVDAADFGVPQHRMRPYWFGHRVGACLTWPRATHGSNNSPRLFAPPLLPWVSVEAALGHLPAPLLGKPIVVRRASRQHHPSDEQRPATTLCASDGGGVKSDRVFHWPWSVPATTVYADERLAYPGHHDQAWMSTKAVRISERGALILQGFPEDWALLSKSKGKRWKMIGEAVPPIVAQRIAESISQWFASVAPAGP